MIYKSLSQLRKEMTGKLVVRHESIFKTTDIGIIKIGSNNYQFLPKDESTPVYGKINEQLFEAIDKGLMPKITYEPGYMVNDYDYCKAKFIDNGFTLFFFYYSVSYVLKE